MKYITLIIGLLVVGCASTPTMESVAGTYERKKDVETTTRMVLLKNGISEWHVNGRIRAVDTGWWSISKDGEIYDHFSDGSIFVLRINKDRSITDIADIDINGKRTDSPKEKQFTYKKIK